MTVTVTMWAMGTAMRLAGDKEGKGKGVKGNDDGNESGRQQRGQGLQGNSDGNKDGRQVDCNGNKEGDGNGNKGGRQATTMVTKRNMAMATRVADNKVGNGDIGKSNGDGNKGGGQAPAMRAMVRRVAGEQCQQGQRQQHWQQCG